MKNTGLFYQEININGLLVQEMDKPFLLIAFRA